jgi:hypothetical protein
VHILTLYIPTAEWGIRAHISSNACTTHFLKKKGFTHLTTRLKSADVQVDDLSDEIVACEKRVYDTFLGPRPDVKALQKLLLPDYLYIQPGGAIWTREENIASLESGVVFSSIEIKNPQVRKLSPTSAVIVARLLIEAAVGEHNLSTETLTSTVWVKQNGKWLAQLHTSTTAAQG